MIVIIIVIVIGVILIHKKNKRERHNNTTDETASPRPLANKPKPMDDDRHDSTEPEYADIFSTEPEYVDIFNSITQVDEISLKHQVRMQDNPAYHTVN